MTTTPNAGIQTGREKICAPRFKTDGELVVASKTIGSELTYRLTTENVSRSGLLLNWHNETKIPFLEKTLLEMTIDPDGKWLHAPVKCMGKVIRKQIKSNDTNKNILQLGVKIVQIDNTDLDAWDACLEDIAKNAGKFMDG